MNKYLKWTLVAFLIFALLFAVGCVKSVLESGGDEYTQGSKWIAMPAIAPAASMDYAVEESYAEPAMYRTGYMPPYYDNGGYGDGEGVDTSIQIIRTGSISLEVDDYFLAEQKVQAFAKKYNGYVSNSYGSSYDKRKSGTVTIKVPEMHFDAVLAELSLLGEIKSKNINGQDVTEQFVSGAQEVLALCQEIGINVAVLKATSPSCGSSETYDGTFTLTLRPGRGITTELLALNGIKVYNEENYPDWIAVQEQPAK